MRLPSIRAALVAFSFVDLAVSVFACGSSSDGAPRQTVQDAVGRTCTITAGAMTVQCDQAPMPTGGCGAGATACFIVGTTGDASGPGAICAGCCSGNTATSAAGDCSNLVCATDSDCPAEYGRCVSGACRY